MTDKELCPTHIIDDLPSDVDSLAFHKDIGPHQRVASTISEIIRSPEEHGGKMIGLEGSWGAGKTTVVNILRKKLELHDDISLFTFDAWAHEGDPLRRTFLEYLIHHFQKNSWVDKEKWDLVLDRLAHRRRITSTRTVPKTTLLGKFFAISVLVVPLGATLLSNALQDGMTINPQLPVAWQGVIGALLTLAPFMVLIGNVFRVIVERIRKPSAHDKEQQELSNWAFLAGEAITETRQDTVETPEPTSLEFETKFRLLMSDALTRANRQAVIVLDNLDRVDPKDALSMWATLQTFLHGPTSEEMWFKRLWILVPYDPSGLKELWDNHKDGNKQIVSSSFLDKSFQLRFEVPPPVLSNWKEYLIQLVSQAMPVHKIEDQRTIYRVYSRCFLKDGIAPTPRALKLFVNQIGLIHRQWQHEYPLDHVAYYVALCRTGKSIRKELLEGTIPEEDILPILSPGVSESLSGLAFNVHANTGLQLLLSDPVQSALEHGEPDRLAELEMNHGDGFVAVFDDVVERRLADSPGTALASAAHCITQSNVLSKRSPSDTHAVIKMLRLAAEQSVSWLPLSQEVTRGIISLIELVDDAAFTETVCNSLRSSVRAQKDVKASIISGEIEHLISIITAARQRGHESAVSKPFSLPVDTEGWIAIAENLASPATLPFANVFMPVAKAAEIASVLGQAAAGGTFSEPHLNTIRVTLRTSLKCQWTDTTQQIAARLKAGQAATTSEAVVLLKALLELHAHQEEQTEILLKDLVDHGHILHWLHAAVAETNMDWQTHCIVAFLIVRPNGEKTPAVGNSEAGFNNLTDLLAENNEPLARMIVSVLIEYDSIGLLDTVYDARSEVDPLVASCFRIVADSGSPEVLIDADQLVTWWSDCRDLLNDENDTDRFGGVVRDLCERERLPSIIEGNEFESTNSEFYDLVLKNTDSESYLQWCINGLSKLGTDQWNKDLAGEPAALHLLIALIEAGSTISLGVAFQDALVKHAQQILRSETEPNELFVKHHDSILTTLSESTKKRVILEVRDAAIEADGQCSASFFELYGRFLEDQDILTEQSEIVRKLFDPLVRERNLPGMSWLESTLRLNNRILDSYDEDSVNNFRERLKSALETDEPDDDISALVRSIAELAGVSAMKPGSAEAGMDNEDTTPSDQEPPLGDAQE